MVSPISKHTPLNDVMPVAIKPKTPPLNILSSNSNTQFFSLPAFIS